MQTLRLTLAAIALVCVLPSLYLGGALVQAFGVFPLLFAPAFALVALGCYLLVSYERHMVAF